VTRLLEGQKGVILGVANKRSIAWSCAKSLTEHGMRLAFTYPNERMQKSVAALAAECEGSIVLPCDVTVPEQIDEAFEAIGNEFGTLDTVMHSVAFAKREELEGNFFNTSKEGYQIAHEISAYSLTAVARAGGRELQRDGHRQGRPRSLGALPGPRPRPPRHPRQRDLCRPDPHPVRLGHLGLQPDPRPHRLARAPAPQHHRGRSRRRRRLPGEQAFLASKLSRGVTGTTMYVDAGYHIMGV
jgi:enoyl-[acyl-carrier protein] reductase I